MPQKFLDVRKLLSRLVLEFRMLLFFILLPGLALFVIVHNVLSGGVFEMRGESPAGPVKLAAHSVGGLLGKSGYLIVTQLLIGYQ